MIHHHAGNYPSLLLTRVSRGVSGLKSRSKTMERAGGTAKGICSSIVSLDYSVIATKSSPPGT
jgi:hypothetical protein